MSAQQWVDLLVGGPLSPAISPGPTLTAAAAASCIPTNNKITIPGGFFVPGKKLRIALWGKISCAVTTPGTARFDVRVGSVVAFDTGALGLNVVAKTNVPFLTEIDLLCTAVGASTSGVLWGLGRFTSEAVVGAVANNVGGNGVLLAPVGAPAAGTGFDSTIANTLDVFFTQTVATGSLTVVDYSVMALG